MPVPQNAEKLRILLGMSTYLAKFCPNLAEITAPLRELTKKVLHGFGIVKKNSQ